MPKSIFQMTGIYKFFLHRFKSDRNEFERGQLILLFAFAYLLISSVYFVIHPYLAFHVPRIAILIFGLVLLAGVFLFRLSIPLNTLAHGLIGLLWMSFSIGVAYSGGIFSLVLPWLMITPLMASLLISQQAAIRWAILSVATLFFFFFFYSDPSLMTNAHSNWRSLVSYTGLMITIFVFIGLINRTHTQLLRRIDKRSKKLKQRKDQLTQQHEEIKEQKSLIERQNLLLLNQNSHIDKVNKLIEQRVFEMMERNQKLERHWKTLLKITKSHAVNFGSLKEALTSITQTVAASLGIDRVSVWRYHKQEHMIHCLFLSDIKNNSNTEGGSLLLSDFPSYFNALQLEKIIPAARAQTDPDTRELSESYLIPLNIKSIMDTPFFVAGELGGVLCCEHTVEREWANEDILFAQALSDIVTLAIMAEERRAYEAALLEKQAEVVSINQNLEVRVKERTDELERQNTQLAEYAFINAHLLRAPLSRLLGLVNLTRYSEIATEERETIIRHIQGAGEELDDVVARINDALDLKNPFNRNFVSADKLRKE